MGGGRGGEIMAEWFLVRSRSLFNLPPRWKHKMWCGGLEIYFDLNFFSLSPTDTSALKGKKNSEQEVIKLVPSHQLLLQQNKHPDRILLLRVWYLFTLVIMPLWSCNSIPAKSSLRAKSNSAAPLFQWTYKLIMYIMLVLHHSFQLAPLFTQMERIKRIVYNFPFVNGNSTLC